MDSSRVLFDDSTIDSKADISKIDHFSERLLFEIYVTEMYTVKPQSKANEFIFSKGLYGGLKKVGYKYTDKYRSLISLCCLSMLISLVLDYKKC